MSDRDAPAWLAELQSRFGAVMRAPLDRSTGTLAATPEAYDAELARACGAEKLAVYNRQYWFRLFEVMQAAFPLVTRLFGAWAFNERAARFLLEHPPRDWDVDRAPDGFEETFAADDLAIEEAARIDAAHRAVFRAPRTEPFRPTAEDAAGLLDARLVLSPAVAIVTEHFALSDLRKKILAARAESRVEVPARLDRARAFALVRRAFEHDAWGTLQVPLEPREAELLTLLGTHSVKDALGALEAACTDEERATLPEKTRAWLAKSVQREFWVSRR